MKKIRFIFIALLLIITCVFYSYEIGKIHNSSFDKREDSSQRIASVVSINIDMQGEPIRVGQEIELESHQGSPLSISFLTVILWMLELLPIELYLLFYQDVVHDDYIAFRRRILNYIHAKDGRKKHNTISGY